MLRLCCLWATAHLALPGGAHAALPSAEALKHHVATGRGDGQSLRKPQPPTAGPASAAKSAAAPAAIPAKTILGVYVSSGPDVVQPNIQAFDSWLGQPVDAVLGYTGGANWDDPNPSWRLGTISPTGHRILWSIPMIPDKGGAAALREAANGQHNSQYTNWAQTILASRAGDSDPIYVRTEWEVGGEWFPYTQAAKDDPAAFVGAFQQFAQSFHNVSSRFKMVWDFAGDRPLAEQWYPGDVATDVISQDVYWHASASNADPVAAFNWALNTSLDKSKGFEFGLTWMTNFAAKHGKPMAISEWGAPGDNGNTYDGATFIKLVKQWIESHDVLYASYWDSQDGGYDGLLRDNDPSATAAALRNFFVSRTSSPTTPTTPPATLRTPENPTGTTAGLTYAYYEATGLSVLPDFTKLTPAASGTVATVDIAPRKRDDDFAFRYTGYVTVPTDGTYTFYTTSDDGSRLYVGDQLVVDNDGLHGAQERSGTIGLKAGTHALTVGFFERGGGQVLSVSYAGPGLSKQILPAAALSSVPAPAATAIVSGGTYRLLARHSGKALDVDGGSSANGAKVQQLTATDNNPNQQWVLNLQSDGAYTLTHKGTSENLDVSGNSKADGVAVSQYLGNTSDAQRWVITPTDNGYYKLVHKNTTKCLDVSGGLGATADGAQVIQYEYVGGNNYNQQWKLERLDAATASTARSTQAAAPLAAPAASPGTAAGGETAVSLSAFPNPSPDGRATLDLSTRTAQTAHLYVRDAQGTLVSLVSIPVPAGQTRFQLPGTLGPGTYFLQTTIDKVVRRFTLKVQ